MSPTDKSAVSIEVARAARAQRLEAQKTPGQGLDPTSAPASKQDSVSISENGRQLLRFEGAAARAAGRDEIVARVKAQVQAGTYRADAQATAQAMGKRSEQ